MNLGDSLELHQDRLGRFRRLSEHGRALTQAVSIDEVLRLTAVCAAELVAADKVVIMLTNAEGLLSVRESHGVDAEVAERFREPVGEDLVERLRALLVADDDRFLGVPLVVNGELIGISTSTLCGQQAGQLPQSAPTPGSGGRTGSSLCRPRGPQSYPHRTCARPNSFEREGPPEINRTQLYARPRVARRRAARGPLGELGRRASDPALAVRAGHVG